MGIKDTMEISQAKSTKLNFHDNKILSCYFILRIQIPVYFRVTTACISWLNLFQYLVFLFRVLGCNFYPVEITNQGCRGFYD